MSAAHKRTVSDAGGARSPLRAAIPKNTPGCPNCGAQRTARPTHPGMKPPPFLSPAEWEVMCVLWQRAPIAAAAATAELRESKRWTLTTVRTLLRRLVQKRAVAQEFDGRRYEYRPLVTMEACARAECDRFFDRVLRRAPPALALDLLQRLCLLREDGQELRRLLSDHWSTRGRGKS